MKKSENKAFRLVYGDKEGVIKGSYTGIPGKDDPALIERDVLEGGKKAEPTIPEPTEEITITENGEYDVKAYASAKVTVTAPEPDPEPEVDNEQSLEDAKTCLERLLSEDISESFEEQFRFKDFSCEDFADLLCTLDDEAFNLLSLKIGAGCVTLETELTTRVSADALDEYNLSLIPGIDVVREMDAETGDSRITASVPGYRGQAATFSGTLTIAYDASKDNI